MGKSNSFDVKTGGKKKMPNINQVYELVNNVAMQSLGSEAVSVVDVSSLVALGDQVLSSDKNTDAFLGALVDRIGKTVFSVRNYSATYPDVVKHPFEFGCIVQKIYVDLPESKANNSWEIGKKEYVPTYAPVIKPSVKQKLFNNINTWEIDVTIPDSILKTAFTNATEMAVLIDAIFTAVDNKMETDLENMVDLTRASFIARKISGGKTCGAINLLHEYNTETNAGLTVDNCLRNPEFLKWSSMQISLWLGRMRRMSTLFNEEGYKRHTPNSDLVFTVLENYASATASFLESDTYHKELVELPRYNTVPYWQGSGTDYSFDSVSQINVKLTADGDATVCNGVIAVAYDYEALGVTINNQRETSERNNKDEYTNYYKKANMGYFNDMSENGIVFYIANA